jgi:hypothetical protein
MGDEIFTYVWSPAGGLMIQKSRMRRHSFLETERSVACGWDSDKKPVIAFSLNVLGLLRLDDFDYFREDTLGRPHTHWRPLVTRIISFVQGLNSSLTIFPSSINSAYVERL